MQMSDIVEELPEDVGLWLGDVLSADITTGTVQYAGWAGYFDVNKLDEIPEVLLGMCAVIVAVWPNDSIAVEGFGSHSIAGWRWLQWDECFRESPVPDDRDIVFSFDWDRNRFMVGEKMTVREWETLREFLERKISKDPKFRGSDVWYYDGIIGNYYLWEL